MNTVTPVNWSDGALIREFQTASAAYNFQTICNSDIQLPVEIPPGYGLYAQSLNALSITRVELAYEVL